MPAQVVPGQPLVYYMGDDARGEYIYKYVSTRVWDPADAAQGGLAIGDKYLGDGRLYAARFNADGSGAWSELNIANPAIAARPAYAFANQADVLIHARLAADALGATPMDRPEWAGVHPVTGEIYITLTNNSHRGKEGRPLAPANPRYYQVHQPLAPQRPRRHRRPGYPEPSPLRYRRHYPERRRAGG